ncbi:2-dehydro-3-deoxyphosphooctonate aldolase putative isoform 1 [Tripterygium wilfordii]|uniref:2-dehydro-3-deoxyphosphooctonate aldolase putative isoform 1 n=1 Tax=Tripterygium wilfordii TaxID=458696 RepID=A0A7J7CR91_TRIWF|nr:2-dehydro-3-deoxyphosphooctonate aldolase putative isoform 1 [Tripterygium wilfordii]
MGVGKRAMVAAIKARDASSLSSSNIGKYLCISTPPRADLGQLISKFLKMHNTKSPGKKEIKLCEEKVRALLRGKERVGLPEITKVLSQHFVSTRR